MAERSEHYPDDAVLLELGRLVFAAIGLERATYAVCRLINPTDVRKPEPPIGQAIDTALKALATNPECETRSQAESWLDRSRDALQERNAVVHSEHVVFLLGNWGEPPTSEGEPELVHYPNKRERPMVRTPVTIQGLEPIRRRIEALESTWDEVAVPLSAWEHRR